MEDRNVSIKHQNEAVASTRLTSTRAKWKADARALELSKDDVDELKALSVSMMGWTALLW